MSKFLKFFKQRRVYTIWLLSYFLILLIFIFMNSIFYLKSYDAVKNEINKNNLMMLEKIREDIDEGLRSAKKLNSKLAVNQNVQTYAKPQNEKTYFQKYINAYSLINEVEKYREPDKWVDDFYLIYHRTNECITPTARLEIKSFYDINVKRDNVISQESWEYLNNQKNKNGFIILNSEKDNEQKNSIAYVSTLPFSEDVPPEITLVVPIKSLLFQSAFRSFSEYSAFIIDENDKILISNGIERQFQKITYDELKSGTNELYLEHNNLEIVYSYIESSESNLKYVVAMSADDYEKELSSLKYLFALCAIIAFFIGIGVSVYVSSKNYLPVSQLMKMMSAAHSENQNEFGVIRSSIDSILREKKKYMDNIDAQNKQLKYFFAADVVKGVIQDENIIEKGFSTYSLKKLSDTYGVILIYVEDMGDIILDKNDIDERSKNEAWNNVQFIIRNIGEELIFEKNFGLVINVEGIMCCLINFNSDDSEKAEFDMKELAEKIQNVLNENFHIITTISIGEPHEGYSGISLSYKQAIELLEYRRLEIENKVINYKDIFNVKNKNFYKYDLSVENGLIKNIKVGNYEAASKIIKDLFNQNLENKTISYRIAKLFKMELFSTVLKVMYEINSAYQIEFADKTQRIEELLKNDNIDETLNKLLAIIKEMCDYINDNKKSHNNNLCENILHEVEEKLFEPNLTSQDIANSFGVTGNYLLRFFKEQMGVGLFDYIHEKRIQKAKELLIETNMRINDIAEFVGYYNTNTFIRIFKKIEGISPGQYRKNQEKLD